MSRFRSPWLPVLLIGFALFASAQKPQYKYFRVGNPEDIPATPRPGFALMGGGRDLDEAFRWLCVRAGGGDVLVLRASGDGEYNPYIQSLCRVNSVATVVIPSRTAANEEFVTQKIGHASALFIAGGDQANYINFWMGTPVQTALNEAIRRGAAVGGTSAGMAVMGEYVYTAQGDKPDDPNLDGPTAMADPFSPRVTLSHGFLDIPILKSIITDTHFARRDRMGRLLTFMARLNERDGKQLPSTVPVIRGIGVEERTAVLLEPDGKARVVGYGSAYFVDAKDAGGPIQPDKPLTFGEFTVQKVAAGDKFDVETWTGDSVMYKLSADVGKLRSTQAGGELY